MSLSYAIKVKHSLYPEVICKLNSEEHRWKVQIWTEVPARQQKAIISFSGGRLERHLAHTV